MKNAHLAMRLTVEDEEETLVSKTIDSDNIGSYVDLFVAFIKAVGFSTDQLAAHLEEQNSSHEEERYRLTPEGQAWLDRVRANLTDPSWPFPVATPAVEEADAAEPTLPANGGIHIDPAREG